MSDALPLLSGLCAPAQQFSVPSRRQMSLFDDALASCCRAGVEAYDQAARDINSVAKL